MGTYQLLKSATTYFKSNTYKDRKDFVFHHISTDEVFGDINDNQLPVKETAKYSPNSPYSSSKAGSDHLVNAWFSTYQLPTLITNCTNPSFPLNSQIVKTELKYQILFCMLQGREQMHAKLEPLCPNLKQMNYTDFINFLRVFFGLTNLLNMKQISWWCIDSDTM